MTTSAPAAFIRGTMTLACSTMPGKRTLPSTLVASQIATPGVTRPRMPTVTGFSPRTLTRLSTYGREDRGAGVPVDRVRRQQREVALALERAQGVEPVVVLVVAQRGGVVADGVHRGGHRVLRAPGDRVDLGEVVGQRRALDGVPRVEGEAPVGAPLGPHGLDERGGLGDADLVALGVAVGGVAEVVPVVDVAVQVGGAEHGQPEAARPVVVPVRAVVGGGGLCVGGGEEPGAADRGHGEQLSAGGGGERVRVVVGHDRRP